MLFKFEKRDWASDYLTQGILPSWNNSTETIRKPILKLNKKPVYAKQIQAKINIITGSLFCKNFTPSPPKSRNRHSRYLR